jgi:DNA-binding CsgD family transcriptional regulator
VNLISIESAAKPRRRQSPNSLTPTEVRILDLAHLRPRDIAVALGMAYGTVRTHQKHILMKLDAETWTQAALLWERRAKVAA